MAPVQRLIEEMLQDDEDADEIFEMLSEGDGEDLDSLEAPLQLDSTFPTAIFVNNLPKVPQAKHEKLLGVLGRMIDKFGKNDKHMPINKQTEVTEGFVIVNFDTVEDADKAAKGLDGLALDKSHTFKVMKLDAFDSIVSRQDEFRAQKTINSFSRADFRDWLNDEKCREQILLRYQSETEIYWHDTLAGEPQLCYGGEREKQMKKIWCDWKVQWSPLGTYLCTFHKQGIALWAGPDFQKKVRFAHDSAQYIDFSPTEEFVVTWNGAAAQDNDIAAVRMFRVLTGECVRKCRTPSVAPLGEWPHFLWSHDGKYFAECNDTQILVRDTDTFELIKDEEGKKKSLKYDQPLSTFQWSPKDNTIAVWTLEQNNNPARAVLVEIPSRRELDSRSRMQVDASLHWQSEGDYLCLLTTKKIGKAGKRGVTNLEIFHIREKNIPCEIVEVRDNKPKSKDAGELVVRGFYWERRGSRFAVLIHDEQGHHPKLLIYSLGQDKYEQVSAFDLPSNSYNNFFWAPDGQYFVCAGIGNGDLLFGGVINNRMEILHKDEHFLLTDVSWDPSSRYVITAVTQPMENDKAGFKYSMEAGYTIWTFQGRKLYQMQKEKLWRVAWRPHPPSLLSSDRQRHIRKNIKQFSKRYDALDEQARDTVRKAINEERQSKTDAFRAILDRLADWKDDKDDELGWGEAFGEIMEGAEWEQHPIVVETELSHEEELISG